MGRLAQKKSIRINQIMDILDVNAVLLSNESGVDRSLIARWQNGSRQLTRRSTQLVPVAEALLRLDGEKRLTEVLAPYRQRGESAADALCAFLLDDGLESLPPRAALPERQASGEYTKEVQVFLGKKGFRRAALAMLDYLQTLPPGREVVVLCQGRYEWIVGNLPFVLQFIAKLKAAIDRDARLLVVNRKGYSIADTAAFAGPWLAAHLHGYIRSVYYEGEMPAHLRFVASIQGFWSGVAEEDAEVEDNLYVEMHTDPRDVRRNEAIFAEYIEKSRPASQYGFFARPQGDAQNARLWREGPLPPWEGGENPTGCFHALCRLPGFGIMTAAEFAEVLGDETAPELPEYLFPASEAFAPGPHRIILCREDVREALKKRRRMHEPLSTLLGRRAFVSNDMLRAQIARLLAAMEQREDFEVALLPRVAFSKLQLELVCWQNSVSVGWLQSMKESVFADDKATSGSFHGFLDYVWDKMLAGWKRKTHVARDLRKWMHGKGLDKDEPVSNIVKNWDAMPKG